MSEDDLLRLCNVVREVYLDSGQVLFSEGQSGDEAYIIQEGQMEIVKISGGREVLIAVRESGEVLGEIALLVEGPRTATIRARTKAALLAIHKTQIDELLSSSTSAARAMLQIVISRWLNTSTMIQQSEKMAQLGTLTAGIAHEMNNPSAAVQRGAQQLRDAMGRWEAAQFALSQVDLTPAQAERLQALAEQARQAARKTTTLDPLTRSDLEMELEDWLADHGVANAWELAPALVEQNLTRPALTALEGAFTGEQLASVLGWLGASTGAYALLEEISQGTARLSEIVKALKAYSYLDQAPVQEVDVHEGLENTLIIMRNRLKAGVTVQREYAPDLPHILAYGSELNQVWTNMIDNAVDAMDGKGTLILRTIPMGDWVRVEIEDSGKGIPQHVLPKIFDPFFTTKPPGKGTGLGLNISYNIIVQKHRGDIRVYSQPGSTLFRVFLPVNFEKTAGSAPVEGQLMASDDVMRAMLAETRTIAVVGMSPKQDRAAYIVPAYLAAQGYEIIPVNPLYAEIMGRKAYPDLAALPAAPDMALIFRRSDEVPAIVEQAIALQIPNIWMQLEIIHQGAAEKARALGLRVVMDTCIRVTHQRLIGQV